MAKSRNSNKSKSLSRQAWKKLKKNKIAVFGMVIISASIVVAILGPLIQPDDTPDANEMALQLTTKKPGFTVKTLRVAKNREEINSNIFKKIIFGEERPYREIPIYDYWFEGENIVVESFTGLEVNNGIEARYNLADVVYSINFNNLFKRTPDGYLEFYDFKGNRIGRSIEDLIAEIEKNHVVS